MARDAKGLFFARLMYSTLLSLGLAGSWASVIKAHDIYTALKDSSGRSCCNDRDCRPAPYRVTSAGVQMLVSGEWILVPNQTIQYRTLDGDSGETAGGHWCGLTGYVTVTLCAILPPSSASATGSANATRRAGEGR